MRTSKVFALLVGQERQFDRERAAWRDERERLLDRIMHLAERPMPEAYTPPGPPDEIDFVDPAAELGDDLFLPLDFVENGTPQDGLSPRERMLRETD